jgi:MFS family permease
LDVDTQGKDTTRKSHVTAIFFWTMAFAAALLLGCAFALSFRLVQSPETLDPFAAIALIQTILLCCGLGVGLFGSGWALTAHEPQRRYGTATTVLGSGLLGLALVIRPVLESRLLGFALNWHLLLIPAAILAGSFALFAGAVRAGRQKPTNIEETTPEPQQPLSQP